MTVTIYHNPRCSKSRQTLALLEERGVQPKVVLYMDDLLSVDVLQGLLKKLKIGPFDLARKKEAEFKELDLENATEGALLKALSEHPRLIERPIVVNGAKAALGRPPEAVLNIL